MAEYRRPSQRYLSGRVKIAGTEALYSDRHLYVEPNQVEPNLGYPGERTIPLSSQYYNLITVENGGVFDRYWQAQSGLEPGGVTIFDEGIQVGLANSVTRLNFVGSGVTATVAGSISTITVSTSARVAIGENPPSGPQSGDLWWESDTGELFVYYDDGDGSPSAQWVETSGATQIVTISDDAPPSPNSGDLWWESDVGLLKIYYNDGDSAQWVDANAGLLDDIIGFWEHATMVGGVSGIHTSVGRVGIATTNATQSLDVNGDVRIRGGIYDVNDHVGTAGSILSSTGSTWEWISPGGAASINNNADNKIITGSNTSGELNAESDITFDGTKLKLNDDIRIDFGNGNDLQISHTDTLASQTDSNGDSIVDGDTSFIEEKGTGGLIFKTNGGPGDGAYQFFDAGWRPILKLFSGSSARAALYHGGSEKLITDSAGISITGGIKDKDGDLGSSGQVLSSTGTALNWVSPQTGPTGAQGAAGSTGAQGAAGPTGSQGATGAQGAEGAQGATGPAGPTGAQGAAGPTGAQGDNGTNGAQGDTGPAGPTGAQGAAGPTGAQGDDGTNGAQGATGPTGAQGASGSSGGTGAQGDTGPTGAQGATGGSGPGGGDGAQGAVGPTGAQGAAGGSGPGGNQGAQGATGPAGPTGAQGAAGSGGGDGPTGAQGAAGPAGPTGAQGDDGSTGAQGAAGAGPTGAQGAGGSTGAQGAQGAAGSGGPNTIGDYIVHSGDTDTKFGFSGIGTVSVETDGTERLVVDHRGHVMTTFSDTAKVGINFSPNNINAGPQYNLQVNGDFYAREMQIAYKTRLTGSLIMDGDNDSQNHSLGGVKHIDIRASGMYRRFSTQPAADWTPNFQHNQSDIDSVTNTGDVFTATIIVKQRSAGSPNGVTVSGVQVDGTATGVDLDWLGGSAPGASPGSGYDVWTFVVMKTSDTPTYHVLGKRETYS